MKLALATITTLFILSIQNQASATLELGLNIPIKKGNLAEFDVDGHELNIGLSKELSAQRKGQRFSYSLFTFTEETKDLGRQNRDYIVVREKADSCGSLHFTAIEREDLQNIAKLAVLGHSVQPKNWIEVVDHARRKCDDVQKYNWDVKMLQKTDSGEVARLFQGNGTPQATLERGWGN